MNAGWYRRIAVTAILAVISATALADSATISYQGSARNADGTPLRDAVYPMTFSIWDAATAGSQLWTETQPTVQLQAGAFSVQLGQATSFGTLFTDHGTLWLQIAINAGSGLEVYGPRVPLSAAAYAKQADQAPTAGTANYAASASDADMVDNQHAAVFAPVGHTHSGADITSGKIANARLNTGAGGGLDADTVDAKHASEVAPAGLVRYFGGAAAPSGWLLCNGAPVSRTTYAALFAAIGTTYGAGDGSTTFNVPDLRGRTVIGLDNMGGTSANRVTAAQADSLGGAAGEEMHTLTTNEMPAHSHGVNDPGHSHTYQHHVDENGGWNGCSGASLGNWYASYASGLSYTGISIQNNGGGAAHNTMPPYMAVNCIIKY